MHQRCSRVTISKAFGKSTKQHYEHLSLKWFSSIACEWWQIDQWCYGVFIWISLFYFIWMVFSVIRGRLWFGWAYCTHIARPCVTGNGKLGSEGCEDTLWPSGQSQIRSCIRGPIGIGFPPGREGVLQWPHRKGGVVLCLVDCEDTGDYLLDCLLGEIG